jgi:hypothetical protein
LIQVNRAFWFAATMESMVLGANHESARRDA